MKEPTKEEMKERIKKAAAELFLLELKTAIISAPTAEAEETINVYYLEEHLKAVHILFEEAYQYAKQAYLNADEETKDNFINSAINQEVAEFLKNEILDYMRKNHSEILTNAEEEALFNLRQNFEGDPKQ